MLEEKWQLLIKNIQQGFCAAHLDFASRYISQIFMKYVPPGSKVLDLGCGEGPEEVSLLEKHGYETIGITVQSWMARDNIEVMDMHDLLFPAKSFDAIYSTMTLEHSYSPWLALAESWVVLRDKGILFMAVPCPDQYLCVTHPTMMSAERWEFLLNHIGFEILNKEKYFVLAKGVKIIYFVGRKTKPIFKNTGEGNPQKIESFLKELEDYHGR